MAITSQATHILHPDATRNAGFIPSARVAVHPSNMDCPDEEGSLLAHDTRA
jgi:hypothetical protein